MDDQRSNSWNQTTIYTYIAVLIQSRHKYIENRDAPMCVAVNPRDAARLTKTTISATDPFNKRGALGKYAICARTPFSNAPLARRNVLLLRRCFKNTAVAGTDAGNAALIAHPWRARTCFWLPRFVFLARRFVFGVCASRVLPPAPV